VPETALSADASGRQPTGRPQGVALPSPPMSRPRPLLLALLCLALLAAACGGDEGDEGSRDGRDDRTEEGDADGDHAEDSTDTTDTTDPTGDGTDDEERPARWEEGDCPDDIFAFDPEEHDAICGTVTVPEDRAEPEGTEVVLPVLVLPATGDDPQPDPVVYLEGGPGGDGLANAATFATAPWREDRSIILFDQRGTGRATPSLDCEEEDEALTELLPLEPGSPEAEALAEELFLACRDAALEAGIDLDRYNSAESVKDLSDIRRVLGEELGFEEWNLLGVSYGTRLALTALRDEPDGIRSVVVDSVYPPTSDLVSEVAPNAAAALATLFERCATNMSCGAAFPELDQTFADVVARLEADPVTVPASSLQSSLTSDVLISGKTVIGGFFQLLYATEFIPLLPLMISDLADGDYEDFADLVLTFAELNSEGISEGMYTSVQCREEIPFSSPDDVAGALDGLDPTLVEVFDNSEDFEDCQTWGTTPGDPVENEPVTSDVPTLLLAGGFDPITPVSWAERAAETLSAGHLVVVESAGHGASFTECGEGLVEDWLDDTSEAPTDDCTEGVGALRWRLVG
jgi:pimeloyl-ACP methyl ester carboxylesterase